MNKFKREMDKVIGEKPRFSESMKDKILLKMNNEIKSTKKSRNRFCTFKVSALFLILLAFIGSFLAYALAQNGSEMQPASSGQRMVPITNFTDQSENWKVTYTQKDLGDGVRSAFMSVEFIGDGQQPEEINYDFTYKKNLESFGGSLLLNEGLNEATVDFDECLRCILYKGTDEIPGEIEWEGQKEFMLLKKTTESKWHESPLFDANGYTMIGEEGRAGFIHGEAAHFMANSPQKYMWHFWGSDVELTGTFKVLGKHENSSEEIIVVPEEKSIPSPNNGADHHIPTTMEIPEGGMWQLKAVFNEKVIGTVYVEVHDK
ncbi:hypothetical protein BN1080_01671 [Planococcus massiliensis]|uniref:DUF4871 domain-containing protein n=1 Tax=Planococcus massiliensis TaxID=1499687 RepID=A0A098EN64_9BACL|nr:hypothetical protein [Planococcus massiliensis]CEG22736.1 hypothetical protein BN1080_01671 [Planococcus massiliensis]